MTGFYIFKKIWLYRAKKQIIEKYSQLECDNTMSMFNKVFSNCQYDMFMIHTQLTRVLNEMEKDESADRLYIEDSLEKMDYNLVKVKENFEDLFKQYRHCVRMYHWMYNHGYHNKYAKIFDDGQDFKWCYESKIEKYELEFKPFDIEYEIKKYKINQRKKELEKDFQ